MALMRLAFPAVRERSDLHERTLWASAAAVRAGTARSAPDVTENAIPYGLGAGQRVHRRSSRVRRAPIDGRRLLPGARSRC